MRNCQIQNPKPIVVKEYGRCCQGSYRAHMRIPDATTTIVRLVLSITVCSQRRFPPIHHHQITAPAQCGSMLVTPLSDKGADYQPVSSFARSRRMYACLLPGGTCDTRPDSLSCLV